MTTKQINDLISFVAMNAMDGVNNKMAAEWIAEQNLDKEIADHLQDIINNIANSKHYIALIANRHDSYDRYWIRSTPNETLEAFAKRMHKCYDYLTYNVDICETKELDI